MPDTSFISGIYNYCDRWCERCAFTERCRVFATQQARGMSDMDLRNKDFWEQMREIFRETLELIHQTARDRGIDLARIISEESTSTPRPIGQVHGNLLGQARKYGKGVQDWFTANREILEAKGVDLVSTAHAELPNTDPVADAAELEDALEVVNWYSSLIEAKLYRVIKAAADNQDYVEPPGAEDFAATVVEQDASVKVALIGMDRSMAAWGCLYQHLPDAADSILELLLTLDRLRREVEQEFPAARSCIRPGLDEP